MPTNTTPVASQIRLPADLMDWLKARAQANFRTMNSEMVAILTQMRSADISEAARQ
ncbi:Arc family DNA-binding protein [Achromobacter sp. GD03932]|uniref:Arc family DNA-binding protein n=1 Tax=Achromobacter sp. GD03932 TaxID=2975407 RepID=UPI00244B4BAA|nr:Arc family DNA-binding protein [Achromobacter sp. GD03932]MDH1299669.1 Arc family DNA-binding protein [Achromobacter sp. GD03932]